MEYLKKITVELPTALLDEAQKQTGCGITETIRQGLKLLAASRAYEDLRKLKGKVKFSLSVSEMKEE